MSIQYVQPATTPATGDPITQLPVDQHPPNNNEVQIIDTLFKQHRSSMDVIAEEAKDSLIVAILIIVLSFPQIDSLLARVLPITETSPYIKVLIKGLIGAVLYWLIKHFYLSRKGT